MGLQTADPLYPVNTTTVDSGTGIDIRLLDSAQAGSTDSTQSVRFTHTQDGQERTFDPGNALVTTETDPLTFQGEGWALRLTEDMTPTDDTNCNAALTDGTLTVNVRALLSASGGVNIGGNTVITFRASLWAYNVSSNSGTLIASGSQSNTWNTTTLGAENNTRKNTAISVTVSSITEFQANEVLFLQIGCEGTTLPNALPGTTNYDITLDVDDANTNLDFASGQGIRQICETEGSSSGSGDGSGVPVIVLPSVGGSSGTATVSGALQADAQMTGSATSVATASGSLGADAQMTGTATGDGEASGAAAVVVPTTGTAEVGAGGTTVRPTFGTFN